MAIETELKLRITPAHLARLRRHALFRMHQISPPATHRLHNIYFDTPDLELHQRKMALRLRRVGGKWIQTLKGGGQVMAGLHQRNEWEVPVPSAKLNFSGLDAAVWDEHLPQDLRARLQPVFITDFYRTSRLIDWQGAVIEVCMDQGEVKTQQDSTPICELELELKSGDAQKLFELAQTLLELVPFELELVSKAEQGFRLLANYTAQPVKSVVPDLAKTDTLAAGLQTLIWSCLSHLQGNLHGVMGGGDDVEYLHQMRVALRRLRVLLSMIEKIRADEELAALRTAFAELGVALGQIREWDVFILETIGPTRALVEGEAGEQGLQALMVHSCLLRDECYAALHLQARDLQRLLLRFSLWMNGSYWSEAALCAPQLTDFSNSYLHRLANRYSKAGRHLHRLDAAQLHALRIRAKKLRYSAEFFASLYDKHKVKSYLCALSEVQELLGQLNDIAVAHRLLDNLTAVLPAHSVVIAFVRSNLDAESSLKFRLLHNYVNLFAKHKIFWKK